MPNPLIRIRIETILKDRNLKWHEVYSKLGIHKTTASFILNGIIVPPFIQRRKIAEALNTDPYLIWDEPIIQTAYELEQKSKEATDE